MGPVTMYTTGWCSDCRRAKWFLKERGIDYREVNIENDPEAAACFRLRESLAGDERGSDGALDDGVLEQAGGEGGGELIFGGIGAGRFSE